MSSAAVLAEPAAPQILSLRTNRASLLVKAQVPKGWQAVVLESRAGAGTGTWVPQAIVRSGLASGRVVFKVPASLQGQSLQVCGLAQEPLAKSFYKGKHRFARRKSSFWQPDQGRGEVFSVGAAGGLPTSATPPSSAIPTRSVVESDIWKVAGDTLYFFNQLRGLQIINITQPDAPVLQGELSMPAVGEDLIPLDPQHLVLLTRDTCGAGWQSQLKVVELSAAGPQVVASLTVPGWAQQSRLVGTALYVVAEGSQLATGPNKPLGQWGTLLTSFDLANPAAPVARSSLWFSGVGNAVLATDRLLLVAVTDWNSDGGTVPGVRVVDISAPDGTMRELAGVRTAGEVTDKYHMSLQGDIFSVISESYSALPSAYGSWTTTLETFSLANPSAPTALGRLALPEGEWLQAARFDGTRAYITTIGQLNQLLVVDLSDPAHPAVAGSVSSPSGVNYLDPLGDRLLTLGYVNGQVTVSLLDVQDPTQPTLLSQVPLGQDYSWSAALYDQQALTVLTDLGLILVPYGEYAGDGWAEGVQLIDLGSSSITARGMIEHRFAPRRSTAHNGRLICVSNQDFLSVDATDRDHPVVTQDLPLAWTVNQVFALGDYLLEVDNGSAWAETAPPTLRMALGSEPEGILNTLTLSNLPIVGLSLHSNLLYILQSPFSFYGGPLPLLPGTVTSPNPIGGTNLLLTIADLSAPPAMPVLSQLSLAPEGPLSGNFQAVWPKPDLLVWFSTGFGYWINPLVDARPLGVLPAGTPMAPLPPPALGVSTPIVLAPMPSLGAPDGVSLQSNWPIPLPPMPSPGLLSQTNPGPLSPPSLPPPLPSSPMPQSRMLASSSADLTYAPASAGPMPGLTVTEAQSSSLSSQPFLSLPYWRPWWGGSGVQLLALDVSNSLAPELVSQLHFNPTNAWGFSGAFAAQGLVYFTHEQPTNCAPPPPPGSEFPIRLDWRVNDMLDVVDFADPTAPTVRPPVNVPGQLTGLAPDGAVLYLLGNAGACAGAALDTRQALNACAYDGVAAYALDSLPLPKSWPRPVLVSDGVAYLGTAAADTGGTNSLQTWALSDSGRFTRLAQVQSPEPFFALARFGSLLAAQGGGGQLSLFDTSTPGTLRACGQGGPSGCLWFDLNDADGALNTGLWLALDAYGVVFVPVAP